MLCTTPYSEFSVSVFMTLVARRLMSAACILMWLFRANTAKYEIASVALQPSKTGRNSFADNGRIAADTNLHKRVFGKVANMAAFWISRSENRHYLNRFGLSICCQGLMWKMFRRD